MTMFRLVRSDIERMRALSGTASAASILAVPMALLNPRLCPTVLIRLAAWLIRRRLGVLAKLVALVNLVLFGIEASPRIEIGPGMFLPHTSGTVIGAARIGRNVTIFQGVTLGAKELDMSFVPELRPTIEDGVIIGAGAKVLGGVRVGAGARIGANAVVITNVPDGALAVGIPAKIIDLENSEKVIG